MTGRVEHIEAQGWTWCDWERLPTPLFSPVAAFVAAGYQP